MSVQRPDWWRYPQRCANGHEWALGALLGLWQRCHCTGAQTLHEDQAIWGHFTVGCRQPGCRSVWYDPPAASAKLARPGIGARRSADASASPANPPPAGNRLAYTRSPG